LGTLTEIIKDELIPGQYPLLKTKRAVPREEALKEWKELVKKGCKKVGQQWRGSLELLA
jgi:hypothetical protein